MSKGREKNKKTLPSSNSCLHRSSSSSDVYGYEYFTFRDEVIIGTMWYRKRGVHTPESGMDFWEESKNALCNLIKGRSPYLQEHYDKGIRIVCDVYRDDDFGNTESVQVKNC